jgi:hypothetical protein
VTDSKAGRPDGDIAIRRLHAQRLLGEPFASAVAAVAWLGAVQSQDYTGARWALGQRTRGATEAEVDRLFDAGAFLRTHVMRPTWHFVLPDDVRWLLDLTADRVKARMAGYDRQLEVDQALVTRSHAAIEAALGGGIHLTRAELAAELERAGIPAAGQRIGNLVSHAELDAIVVSGARRGRQMTYALLDERAPGGRRLDRDEALAELTRRYFSSHGPAQAHDLAWWSGLTVADARRGVALNGPALAHEVIGGRSYWSSPGAGGGCGPAPVAHLLPNYDELTVAYRDRAAALDPVRGLDAVALTRGGVLDNVVALNGRVRCGWRRRPARGQVVVELDSSAAMDDAAEDTALGRAADHLARFLGVPVTVGGPAGS